MNSFSDRFPVASYKENENGEFDIIDQDGQVFNFQKAFFFIILYNKIKKILYQGK